MAIVFEQIIEKLARGYMERKTCQRAEVPYCDFLRDLAMEDLDWLMHNSLVAEELVEHAATCPRCQKILNEAEQLVA